MSVFKVKMEASNWHDELNKLAGAIEPQTIASLQRINNNGMPFDDRFKQQFLNFISERMSQTYDRLRSQQSDQCQETKQIEDCTVPETVHHQPSLDCTRSTITNDVISFTVQLDSERPGVQSTEVTLVPSTCGVQTPNTSQLQSDVKPVIDSNENHLIEISQDQCDVRMPEFLMNFDSQKSVDTASLKRKWSTGDESQRNDEVIKRLKKDSVNNVVDHDLIVSEMKASCSRSIDATMCQSLVQEVPKEAKNGINTIGTLEQSISKKGAESDNVEKLTNSMELSGSKVNNFNEIVIDCAQSSGASIIHTEVEQFKGNDGITSDELNRTTVEEMIFSCALCPYQATEYKPSVEALYPHWLSVHSSEPFQYHVHITMRCIYCDHAAPYHQLVDHHRKQHSGHPFVVVNLHNNFKCGLCTSPTFETKSELIAHFNNTHESYLQASPLNPIILDDKTLLKLLSQNANRYRCLNCDRIFESLVEIAFHHTIDHADTEISMEPIIKSLEPQMICDYCHMKIVDREKYLNHIEEHEYRFDCGKCNFKTGKLIEVVMHDKQQHRNSSLNYRCLEFCEMLKRHFSNTRVVFENGLVLFNHNLINTNYGGIKILIDIFCEDLMKIIKQKYKAEHESGELNSVNITVEPTPTIGTPAVNPIPNVKRPTISTRSLNMRALRAQNRLINNLCIYGIPYFNNENKEAIFLSLCWKLQVNIFPRDIVKITRSPGKNAPLIVELKKFCMKERILQSAYMQQLWSSDLIHLPFGVAPIRVFINIHTTKVYGHMAKIARNAMKNNTLHTFWITKFGFLVKRTVNSKDKIVLSTDELVSYINQRKQPTINRNKPFYRPIEWVPKSTI
ncbi:uncharacterized protein LOC116349782 [Contarinia nasturtii]|uniref:uncharacterized protein LOC116349782 n=1 Tax=Contarinia nasturtii TaxID=265458 RepID=UPI0012D43D43|nr:uncharacterized protein LOC116349782 [Contarinia nasturtii]